ncbi:MAG: cell division protein SepF [Firmicutes bacterium]|nr:cell division protein SepF [Bacillota bacterium]
MASFNNFFKGSSNFNGGLEYYEDTHDKNGVYRPHSNQNLPRFDNTKQLKKGIPPHINQNVFGVGGTPFAPNPPYMGGVPLANSAQGNAYGKPNPNMAYGNPSYINQVFGNTAYQQAMPLPNERDEKTVHNNYQNVIVYEPKNPEEVQALISYLKRKEPAIINLDKLELSVAQRILDYMSGAIYALGGSVCKISDTHIYLLSPMGVTVSTSIKDDFVH